MDHPAPLQPKTGDSPCFGGSVVCSVLHSTMLYHVVIVAITLTRVGLRASILLDTSKAYYSCGLTEFMIIRGVAGSRKSCRSQTWQLYNLVSCICTVYLLYNSANIYFNNGYITGWFRRRCKYFGSDIFDHCKKKKVHMDTCLILNGYRHAAVWISRPPLDSYLWGWIKSEVYYIRGLEL